AAIGAGAVTVLEGELSAGAPKHGPFEVIIVEGAVTAVPPKLLKQLKDGGRLVALIRQGAAAVANVYVRSGDGIAARAEFNASLPLLRTEAPPDNFVF